MTTIVTKNGSGAPLASDLVQGELAVDLTNKRLYTENSGGSVIEVGTNPTSLTTGTFTSTGIDDNATSTAITIDASENVGIGTASPSTAFHVSSSGVSTPAIIQGTSTVSRIAFQDAGTTDANTVRLGSAGNDMSFLAGGTERMRIDASGNVGIGTDSPSQKLHIIASASSSLNTQYPAAVFQASSIAETNSGTVTIGGYWDNTNSNLRRGYIQASNTTGSASYLLLNPNGGNVGIGTTSPDTILEVVGADPVLTIRDADTSTTTANATLRLAESGAGDTLDNYWDIGLKPVGAFAIGSYGPAGSGEAMRIDASGNVGIGTDSPNRRLTVSSTSGVPAELVSTASTSLLAFFDSGTGVRPSVGSDGSDLVFNATSERMRISSSGNVGIGKITPGTLLDVGNASNFIARLSPTGTNFYPEFRAVSFNSYGVGSRASIYLGMDEASETAVNTGTSFAYRMKVDGGATGQYLQFIAKTRNNAGGAETERMRLDSSGNLLVGKTSPSYATVGCELRATGGLYGTADNASALTIRRNGVDGDLATFWNDGSQVATVQSNGTWNGPISDISLKKNIKPSLHGLSDVLQINVVSFDWKKSGSVDDGFIAQELKEVIPSAVSENEQGLLGRVDANLLPVLVKAIQEQQAMIEELKAEVAALKGA